MALVVAVVVADGQVVLVTAAALAQRLDMFQGRGLREHMLATHPARYLAMQLAGHGVVDLDAGVAKSAHVAPALEWVEKRGLADMPENAM